MIRRFILYISLSILLGVNGMAGAMVVKPTPCCVRGVATTCTCCAGKRECHCRHHGGGMAKEGHKTPCRCAPVQPSSDESVGPAASGHPIQGHVLGPAEGPADGAADDLGRSSREVAGPYPPSLTLTCLKTVRLLN